MQRIKCEFGTNNKLQCRQIIYNLGKQQYCQQFKFIIVIQQSIQNRSSNLQQFQANMYKFQIRFAQTGHPQIFQQINSIQMLQQLILRQFKIQIQHQRLINKKGIIIKDDQPDYQSALKKTFAGDHNNPNSLSEVVGLYLFNHKQLLKNQPQQKQKTDHPFIYQQSKSILKKRHQYCQGLRPKIYQLQSLTKKFDSEQLSKILLMHPFIKDMSNSWLNSTMQMFNSLYNFKQNQQCLDLFIQKWENQRKALLVLIKNLHVTYEDKVESIRKSKQNILTLQQTFKELHRNQQNLSESIQNSSKNLRNQNSAQNSKSYKQNQVYMQRCNMLSQNMMMIARKTSNLSIQVESVGKKIKQFNNYIRTTHKQLQKPLKLLDHTKRKKFKQIQGYFGEMKQNYSTLMQAIRSKIEKGQDQKIVWLIGQKKNIQQKYTIYKKKGIEYSNEIQEKFIEMYGFHVQHQLMVRNQYKKYNALFIQLEQNIKQSCQKTRSQIYTMYKTITDLKQYQPSASPPQAVSLSSSLVIQSQDRQKQRNNKKQSPQKPFSQANNNNVNNSQKSVVGIKQLQQTQQHRRMNFFHRIQSVQQQLKQIYKQEEKNRKKFLSQAISAEEMYDNQVMVNVRVPCILINYDQTSDLELFNKFRNSHNFNNSGVNNASSLAYANLYNNSKQSTKKQNDLLSNLSINLQFYKDSGMDRVLKQLDCIKSCQVFLKSQNIQTQTKMRNMQIILQKSSDIFHHIYNNKLNILTKQHKTEIHTYSQKIKLLERQKKQLSEQVYNYSKNLSQEKQSKKQLENVLAEMQRQNNRLRKQSTNKLQIQLQFNKELEDKIGKIRKYENVIQENKKQISKLKQQKKQIQEKITKQVSGTMETLLLQLEKETNRVRQLQQANHQYKIVMGDQAVRIQTLQAQMKILKSQNQMYSGEDKESQKPASMDKLKQSFYGENLKYISDQNKNIPVSEKSQNSVPSFQRLDDIDNHVQLINPSANFMVSQVPLLKRQSKSITNQQIKQIQRQITKLQKKIEQLKQQNQELKNQNINLNDQIMKIAMKDTQDVQVQTQEEKDGNQQIKKILDMPKQSLLMIDPGFNYVKIDQNPQPGQMRIFLPFSQGVYIAIKSSKNNSQSSQPSLGSLNYLTSETRNYINLHQSQLQNFNHMHTNQLVQQSNFPFILDLNCLSPKARQLLLQCTLVVVIKVTKILPGADKNYVEGQIVSAIGFEDQELSTKDYGPYLS